MARLGDCFSVIRNGASIKQTRGAGGIPITRIETISNREIDRNKFGYAGISDVQKYQDYLLQDCDILMSHINSTKHLGKVAIYHKIGDEQIIHGMNLLLLRAKQDLLFPQYVFYYFDSAIFRIQIMRIKNDSVNQSSFTVTALKELQIPLPPLDEQRRIAAVLDKVSRLIALRKQQAKMLDVLVRARFAQVFGDPQLNPKGWEVARLGEVCSFYSGTAFPNKYQGKTEGEFPFFKVGDISKNVIAGNIRLLQSDNYINSDVVRCIKGTIVPPDTVVFAKIGEGLKLNRRAITICNCLIDNNVIGVRANEGLLDTFYFYYFMCNIDMAIYSEVTVVPSVRKSRIENITIPLPPLALQQEFAAFAEKAQGVKAAVARSTEQLETLKKALMQKFFFEEAQG